MPLSEDEKRILAEIEEGLYKSDPSLSRDIGTSGQESGSLTKTRTAVLGIAAGLLVVLVTLEIKLLSLAGVVLIFASALLLERTLHRQNQSRLTTFKDLF